MVYSKELSGCTRNLSQRSPSSSGRITRLIFDQWEAERRQPFESCRTVTTSTKKVFSCQCEREPPGIKRKFSIIDGNPVFSVRVEWPKLEPPSLVSFKVVIAWKNDGLAPINRGKNLAANDQLLAPLTVPLGFTVNEFSGIPSFDGNQNANFARIHIVKIFVTEQHVIGTPISGGRNVPLLGYGRPVAMLQYFPDR